MKKLIAAVSALAVMAGMAIPVSAESAEVYVTISDSGNLALSQEKITVTDIDSDGALTINDALYIAHEEHFSGGAESGYVSENSEYGISLIKLWGTENGGSYGYCVNDVSAMSLSDTISSGDRVCVYSFADLTGWSDKYSFFNANTVNASVGDETALILSINTFDAEWNPLTVTYEGAEITINGEKTGIVTDGDGKADLSFDKAGEYIISAVSDADVIVPPVCRVTVSDVITESPATGNSTGGVIAVGAVALAAAIFTRKNEK